MEGGLMTAKQGQKVKVGIEDATKHYQTSTGVTHALEGVSFDVREGELCCLLGPSGCGKTTLLWSMAGLHSLTRGKITIDGEPVTKPHPQVAMMFQEANLLPWRNLTPQHQPAVRDQGTEAGRPPRPNSRPAETGGPGGVRAQISA